MDACDLFGGREELREKLVGLISEASRARQDKYWRDSNLKEYPSPNVKSMWEPLTGNHAMSCFYALRIQLDEALPLPKLTQEQKEYWAMRAQESGHRPVHVLGARGFNPEIALKLYIQLCALDELDRVA